MTLPTLYEAVDVRDIPAVKFKEQTADLLRAANNNLEFVCWLRPYTAEELVRRIVKETWETADRYRGENSIEAMALGIGRVTPDLQTFTDNLVKEMRK